MNETLIETQNLPRPVNGQVTTPRRPSAKDKSTATHIGVVGGAASGVATGVAVGAATAGPVGAAVGGVIGAVAGAAGGKALADAIGPAADDDVYWADAYSREPYYRPGTPYAQYRPAYQHGWQGVERYPGSYAEAETRLAEDWLRTPGRNMSWDEARPAVQAAWERAAVRRASVVAEAQAVDPDDLIDTLNNLLEMCRDGEAGFRHASSHAKTPIIVAVLERRAIECTTAVVELEVEIERLGGKPAEHGSLSAALQRGWTSLKTVFSTEDDKIVLDACVGAEEDALKVFDEALNKPMPTSARAVVQREREIASRCRAELMNLRKGLV